MNKKSAAFTLVWTLVFTLVTTSVCAQSTTRTDSERVVADAPSQNTSATVSQGKRNEKVKADVLKLVADTKAGKVAPRAPSPFQQTHRNNMSTGAKIAIVAIIAGTVFLIFAVHAINSD